MEETPHIAAYTAEEERLLLDLARQTLRRVASGQRPLAPDLAAFSPALCEPRACFVTLRTCGEGLLRGCTGTLLARRPLAEEVVAMTVQTALHDPRFRPVTAWEVDGLHIEISVLTPPQPLDFAGPDDLLARLRPGVDGVTLYLDQRRATFLPSVWESHGEPEDFLSLLAQKMGLPANAWRRPGLEVETYQAIVIEEPLEPGHPTSA